MAQALRTVWLEPEEQQEAAVIQLRARRRSRALPAFRKSSFIAVSLTTVLVASFVAYISTYAAIARYEFQRQAQLNELRQIQTDCARLRLEIANLESPSRLLRVAKAQNLGIPSPDRVHYMKVKNDLLQPKVAMSAPKKEQTSWFKYAGHQMMTRLSSVFNQLGRGPGAPAYAQD